MLGESRFCYEDVGDEDPDEAAGLDDFHAFEGVFGVDEDAGGFFEPGVDGVEVEFYQALEGLGGPGQVMPEMDDLVDGSVVDGEDQLLGYCFAVVGFERLAVPEVG